jgi:predicted ATPase
VGSAGVQPSNPRTAERPSGNLPLAPTSFVGRDREVAEVGRLLSERQLLTLCGPGGAGKTRLALAVASRLGDHFEDGVWWVELAPISDPNLVAQAVAQTLMIADEPGRPLADTLARDLAATELLLVLDNCEHLIEACAELADALLRACPDLQILATSREPLRISGEASFMVPSLSVPDPGRLPAAGDLAGYEAVRLFVERTRAVDPSFALMEQNALAVADVCRKLDGIPLAIELAAARTRVLTVEQISEKLDDPLGLLTAGSRTAAARHRTLRATLQWSHGLLDEQEQELFRRLSMFAGGWDLEAAEAVGAAEPAEAGRVLDLLSGLVEKSLVVAEAEARGAVRYGMLEPVRHYALELLEEGGETGETRGRHAAFFAALAEEAYPKLRAVPQVEWLRRLDKENDNLRGALSWALSADDIPTAARLGYALWTFWWIRNRQIEGRRWMEQVLPGRDGLPPPLRIRATIAAAAMAYGQGDTEAVVRYTAELVELSRAVGGDALAEAFVHAGTGLVATDRGDLEAAAPHLEEALPLFREAGEDGLAAQTPTWPVHGPEPGREGEHAQRALQPRPTRARRRRLPGGLSEVRGGHRPGRGARRQGEHSVDP